MRIALLIILAIIVWFVYKALSKKPSPDSSEPAKLDGGTDNAVSAASQAAETVSDAAKSSAAGAGSAAIAGAAAAAVGGKPAHTAAADDSSLFPSTGNIGSDIAEMFKVLNLRASDAPRLSLSTEQYEALKSGNTGDLSSDVLDAVMQKLKGML